MIHFFIKGTQVICKRREQYGRWSNALCKLGQNKCLDRKFNLDYHVDFAAWAAVEIVTNVVGNEVPPVTGTEVWVMINEPTMGRLSDLVPLLERSALFCNSSFRGKNRNPLLNLNLKKDEEIDEVVDIMMEDIESDDESGEESEEEQEISEDEIVEEDSMTSGIAKRRPSR